MADNINSKKEMAKALIVKGLETGGVIIGAAIAGTTSLAKSGIEFLRKEKGPALQWARDVEQDIKQHFCTHNEENNDEEPFVEDIDMTAKMFLAIVIGKNVDKEGRMWLELSDKGHVHIVKASPMLYNEAGTGDEVICARVRSRVIPVQKVYD